LDTPKFHVFRQKKAQQLWFPALDVNPKPNGDGSKMGCQSPRDWQLGIQPILLTQILTLMQAKLESGSKVLVLFDFSVCLTAFLSAFCKEQLGPSLQLVRPLAR